MTVSSEIFGSAVYYVNGYSFEEEKYVSTMNSGGSVADIIPENVLKVNGEVTGMILSAQGVNTYGFYKNFESSVLAEAENFFNNYLNVEADPLYPLSDTLKAGQVYTFRTYKKNYVKILVKDVRIQNDSPLKDYVEADLRYFIQRDGAEIFDE